MKTFSATHREADTLYQAFNHGRLKFTFAEGDYEVSDDFDLDVAVNRFNMCMTLQALDGKDYKAILGPDCALNYVKVTGWEPDTCDCRTTYLWRRDHDEDVRQHYPHRGERHCRIHAHLKDDHHAHCNELWAENRHKCLSHNALAKHLNVPITEVHWVYGVDRTLYLSHPSLDDASVFRKAQDHMSKHEHASKRPLSLHRE